jgi:hypothetical protein
MSDTIMALIANSSGVDVLYTHTRSGKSVVLDTKEIRSQIGTIPITSAEGLSVIRGYLNQEENTLVQ